LVQFSFTNKPTDSLVGEPIGDLGVDDRLGHFRSVQFLLAFHSEPTTPKQLGYIMLLYFADRLPSYVPPHVRTTFESLQPTQSPIQLHLPDDEILYQQIPDRIDRAAWKALWLENALMSKERTLENLQKDAIAVIADLTHLEDPGRVRLGVAVLKRVMFEAHQTPWDIITHWFQLLYYNNPSPDAFKPLFKATAAMLHKHEIALCLAISVLCFEGVEARQDLRQILWREYVRQCGTEQAASTLLVKVLHFTCTTNDRHWALWYMMLDKELNFEQTFSDLGLGENWKGIWSGVQAKFVCWFREMV